MEKEYDPFLSAASPKLVPTRNTFAPNRGSPVTESLTVPVIVAPFTDEIRGPNNSKHKDNTKLRWFIIIGNSLSLALLKAVFLGLN